LFVFFLMVTASVAQNDELKKLNKIFSTNHFTVTVESNEEEKVYEFSKHDKVWEMEYSERSKIRNDSLHHIRKKKVFWDNFYTLESLLTEKTYTYYSAHEYYEMPLQNELSYKVANERYALGFNARYFNIKKVLNYIGWNHHWRTRRYVDLSTQHFYNDGRL
jgi:hypothetical protein